MALLMDFWALFIDETPKDTTFLRAVSRISCVMLDVTEIALKNVVSFGMSTIERWLQLMKVEYLTSPVTNLSLTGDGIT